MLDEFNLVLILRAEEMIFIYYIYFYYDQEIRGLIVNFNCLPIFQFTILYLNNYLIDKLVDNDVILTIGYFLLVRYVIIMFDNYL